MMSSAMRDEDRAELIAGGYSAPRHMLFQFWRDSVEARAGFIDGDLAAMFGWNGALASSSCHVWLVTTPVIERMPVAFAKEARAFLQGLLATKRQLLSGCVAGYDRSLRFWRLMGFRILEPAVVPQTGALFHTLVMER